jgi:formamidase
LWLPTEIFDFDINPGAAGPTGGIKGGVAMPLAPDL